MVAEASLQKVVATRAESSGVTRRNAASRACPRNAELDMFEAKLTHEDGKPTQQRETRRVWMQTSL